VLMRNPTRTALRWGAPVALAAAAIAALFVVPVFGGTTSKLKRQVNAIEARQLSSTIGGSFKTVVALRLKPGNYLLTANYESGRQPREFVACNLEAGEEFADFGSNYGPDLPPSQNQNDSVITEHPTLSGVVHLDTRTRATLKCRTEQGHQTGFLHSKIIALRLPKVTVVPSAN
jgi:hypothetical protein